MTDPSTLSRRPYFQLSADRSSSYFNFSLFIFQNQNAIQRNIVKFFMIFYDSRCNNQVLEFSRSKRWSFKFIMYRFPLLFAVGTYIQSNTEFADKKSTSDQKIGIIDQFCKFVDKKSANNKGCLY